MQDLDPLVDRVVLAFDSSLWTQAGGDIEDNSCFWRLAIVDRVYRLPTDRDWRDLESVDWLADLEFIDSKRYSKGHFVSSLKYSKAITP